MNLSLVLCLIVVLNFKPVGAESDTGTENLENDVSQTPGQRKLEENIDPLSVADDVENDPQADETVQKSTEPDENNIVVDNRKLDNDQVESERRNFPHDDLTFIKKEKDFYSFTVNNIKGEPVQLEKYRGKVSLVVNVASECGFTEAHYTGLVRLRDILQSTGKFNVLAFPCNQFGAQEPGENSEIEEYVKKKFHVNFPLFSKIRVLDSDVPKAWQYLTEKSGRVPNWNFWKYLVNEDGEVVDSWGPWTSVEDLYTQIQFLVDKLTRTSDPILPNMGMHDAGEL